MFLGLVYRLRASGVPVGLTEALALADALRAGAHDHTLTGFYYTARAILIHHEGHFDAFDVAFAAEFAGGDATWPTLTEEIDSWLDTLRDDPTRPAEQPWPTDDEIAQWRRRLAERLAEQTSRHDGGSHWIGTGGTSPHGQAGAADAGLSTETSGGGRSAIALAEQRSYRGYRSDVILDTRQFEVALRRLRAFIRQGADVELDLEATIDATARNAGDIDIVTRAPQRPDTHLLVLADVGGSMYPYGQLVSQLFSAAKKATHFADLQTFHFHNCVYGRVYPTEEFTDPVWVADLLRRFDERYNLVVVGDALMGDYELHMRSATGPTAAPPAGEAAWVGGVRGISGLDWLRMLRDHFDRSVWLTPEPPGRWRGTTIETIASVFDMYPLTVDGLTEAMAALARGRSHRLV